MGEAAPYFEELAEGPPGGRALWVRAEDGVRIRVGLWPGGSRGTVLLFPGRTEYIEKYGRAAADFAARGYATAVPDWRGQGLADRLLPDRRTGHVQSFADYRRDARALVAAVRAAGLPEPYHLAGHSMGGAIGLGALHDGLPVRSAVFTGPMWGIAIPLHKRPLAWALSWSARRVRLGHANVPGTAPGSHVLDAGFGGNMLTTDAEMFDYMRRQITAQPELALGGPSLHWLHEALVETRRLQRLSPPAVPAVTFLGTRERIVDTRPIRALMGRWADGRLEIVEDAEHEVLMEGPAIRRRVFDMAADLFAGA